MTIPLRLFTWLFVWCALLVFCCGQISPVNSRSGACVIRPPGCILNCAQGFSWGLGSTCICLCYVNPCTSYPCTPGQVCISNNGIPQCILSSVSGIEIPRFPSLISRNNPQTELIGECPRLNGGSCSRECHNDHDCPVDYKCCHNGCGTECVQPVEVAPVKSALPIFPIAGISRLNQRNGRTWCLNLLRAVKKLPNKILNNGYLPECNDNGDFKSIQCDDGFCWCVNPEKGTELLGTRLSKTKRNDLDCHINSHCDHLCEDKQCIYGLKTDSRGCPLAGCQCKSLCDGVRCHDKVSECQLKESSCHNCPPVPVCLINPCPHGLKKLKNGVTALCRSEKQCGSEFWCNQIGFEGLGFCCSDPESARRAGECKKVEIDENLKCTSECRADSDCSDAEKCCFSGCGLKCTHNYLGTRLQIPIQKKIDNKKLISRMSQCPSQSKQSTSVICNSECETDSDCDGLRRCCVDGCSKKCTYPLKTTPCLHHAISSQLFSSIYSPDCSSDGYFEIIQCAENYCYCVNRLTGSQIPGTLVTKDKIPNCNRPRSCELRDCNCKYGSELDKEGCETCRCINPCSHVRCPIGNLCIMVDVECLNPSSCPQQPRCVPNVCNGKPATYDDGRIQQCSRECDIGYQCNNVGFPEPGGICCEETKVEAKKHGECPKMSVNISPKIHCHIECFSDDDCKSAERCCFNGCGMQCTSMDSPAVTTILPNIRSGVVRPAKGKDKIGRCQKVTESAKDYCRSGRNECTVDSDCDGIQKCCYNGCFRRCIYPHTTTACLHLQAAYEQLGKEESVKCNEDGSFKPVKCDDTGCWCIDSHGQEMMGTRVEISTKPSCIPRICPVSTCLKNCPYGYVKDKNGCDVCECFSPCNDVNCPIDYICVTEPVDSLNDVSVDVPKCVPNVCHGSPMRSKMTSAIVRCFSDSECPLNSNCRNFGLSSGICCSGKGSTHLSGECPKASDIASITSDCHTHCKDDNDCSNSKCCYNGCGTSCVTKINGKSKTRDGDKPLSGTLQRDCPTVSDLGIAICTPKREDQCVTDKDCAFGLTCCFDGCIRSCTNPGRTSQCLHLQSAIQSLVHLHNEHLKLPLCEPNGEFSQIQKSGDQQWCADRNGNELPGTRSNTGPPDCKRPRICPTAICPLSCDFGYKIGNDGCEICECLDPCHHVECPLQYVCRSVKSNCTDATSCNYIPKCIPNICPRGDPLTIGGGSKLLECNNSGITCPPGWSCHHFGFEKRSYCCAGISTSRSTCPDVFTSFSKSFDIRQRRIECKTECENGRPCCFDGYGVRCIVEKNVMTRPLTQTEKEPSVVHAPPNQYGSCPSNRFMNPGCQNECLRDHDCPDFQLCCSFGCGRRCLFPDITHNCIHRLAVFAEELIKYAQSGPLISPKSFDEDQLTQCNVNGDFKEVQCDKKKRQCWCVEKTTGAEVMGTRSPSSTIGEPNCKVPRKCSIKCHDEELECEYGLRLDTNGCPLNGKCECLHPCEQFSCLISGEICVLKKVNCLDSEKCIKQPVCRPSICPAPLSVMKDNLGLVVNCKSAEDCGQERECRSLATTNYQEGHRVGICCGSNYTALEVAPAIKPKDLGICPPQDLLFRDEHCEKECESDADCSHDKLCCKYGCSTICRVSTFATRCHSLNNAIQNLINRDIKISLTSPLCDTNTGLFLQTQCNDEGHCWCVDKEKGTELVGTRKYQPSADACHEPRKNCALQCTLDEVNACPLGLDLNSEGCPKTSQCRCFDPCESIQCPDDEMCLLRWTSCEVPFCLPVPVCQRNPCLTGFPLKDVSSTGHLSCFENRSQSCPSSHICTGLDNLKVGVCCPATDPTLLKAFGDVSCPHGTPFIAQDRPAICLLKQANSCPSTHYCVASNDEGHGICCPTKRFVCNLEVDIGSCNNPMERYLFKPETQRCESFVYSGCDGNLNNFETEKECKLYCRGLRMDEALEEDGMQYYHVGFTFTGPLMRQRHTEDFTNKLRDYIRGSFELELDDIRDLLVKDDNSVRFNLVSNDAEQKADLITKKVESGQLYFRYGDHTYHAEPSTLFARLVNSSSNPRLSGPLYWLLLTSSAVVCLIVLFSLFMACIFVKSRSKSTNSVLRGLSPSPYGQINAFTPPQNGSPSSSRPASAMRTKKTISVEDIYALRMAEVGPSSSKRTAQERTVPSQMHGVRRPTRTTLYY